MERKDPEAPPQQSPGRGTTTPSESADVPTQTLIGTDMGRGTVVEAARERCSVLGWRLRQELDLFQQQWPMIALAMVVWYIACPLAMNAAYYRFRAGDRLQDVGFEVLPELPEEMRFLSEYPFQILGFSALAMLLFAQMPASDGQPKPYAINALRRFITVFAAAHTLRAATFLSTTMPGVAVHCMEPYDWRHNQPKKMLSFLPNPGWPAKNCGE